MNSVNRTLYIPLYGKSFVSRKGMFLRDPKAEEIWDSEGFLLTEKAASKWLAYYMGIRSAVFDDWLRQRMREREDAVILHIGCGLDSRILRVGNGNQLWFDVDFPEVIRERKRYFSESDTYRMIGADVRTGDWLKEIPDNLPAVIVMEGVSMYLTAEERCTLLGSLRTHFSCAVLLMDCYTLLAAKMSKYKNPINSVGITEVYGMDEPELLCDSFAFAAEHEMTPQRYIDELTGMEKRIFRNLYAGKLSKKLYRLYEYRSR